MKEKHKFSPPWEGPYMVTKVIRPGAYRLKDDNGNILTNTWNIKQLHSFFPLKLGEHSFIQCLLLQAPQPEHSWPGLLGGSTRV